MQGMAEGACKRCTLCKGLACPGFVVLGGSWKNSLEILQIFEQILGEVLALVMCIYFTSSFTVKTLLWCFPLTVKCGGPFSKT